MTVMRFRRGVLVAAAAVLLTFSLPLGAVGNGGGAAATHREYDEHGRLASESGEEPGHAGVSFVRHYHWPPSSADDSHRPGHGGGGGSLTDCTSTAYRAAAWKWTGPYSASASSFSSVADVAGSTWDTETSVDIFGSITPGSGGVAGQLDGVNQLDWTFLGAGGTIAVTTTWYYTASGVAVESDGQYNTYYAWATDGSPGAMDVENIVAHEIGHTFGLNHPNGNPAKISCLTMYAYGSEGETHKRTLGDGDILGIRAVYGT